MPERGVFTLSLKGLIPSVGNYMSLLRCGPVQTLRTAELLYWTGGFPTLQLIITCDGWVGTLSIARDSSQGLVDAMSPTLTYARQFTQCSTLRRVMNLFPG